MKGENWKNDTMNSLYQENGKPTENVCSQIVYHEKIVNFHQEWKIKLPLAVTEDHYLLFYIYNIDNKIFELDSKTAKSIAADSKYDPYQRIGFTWLPLLEDKNQTLLHGTYVLPIANHNCEIKSGFSSLPPDAQKFNHSNNNSKDGEFSWIKGASLEISVRTKSSIHCPQFMGFDRLLQLNSAYEFMKLYSTKISSSQLSNLYIKVFGSRINQKMLGSEYKACLTQLINNYNAKQPSFSMFHNFAFFPQIFTILLELILKDQHNNAPAFETLVNFIDSLTKTGNNNNEHKMRSSVHNCHHNQKNEDFQTLALDSPGLNQICNYIDENFNPLQFYQDILINNKESTDFRKDGENLSHSASNLVGQNNKNYSSGNRISDAMNHSDLVMTRPKSESQNSNSGNKISSSGQGSVSSSNYQIAKPTKIITTIHYELAHFWKIACPEIRQKIHSSSLFFFKLMIKSLAISVQLDKRTLKPAADNEFKNSIFKIVEFIVDDMKNMVQANPSYAKRLAYAFSYFMDWNLSILDKDFCVELIKLVGVGE